MDGKINGGIDESIKQLMGGWIDQSKDGGMKQWINAMDGEWMES